MKSLLLIILILFGKAFTAEPEYLKYHKAFGIKASNLSGYGAFYGYKPVKEVRLQVTGIPYFFDQKVGNERWTITNYTIGMEIQKDIIQEEKYRCYLMTGGYYYHDNDKTASRTDTVHIIKNSYNCGLGFGYEYFFHRITLGIEIGYKYYYDKSVEAVGNGEYIPVQEKVSKLGAGLNLGFIF